MRRIRPTPRGAGLLLVGVAAVLNGTVLGVRTLVQVGALLLLVVLAGIAGLLLEAHAQTRGRLRLTRSVDPHPMTVGHHGMVTVEVRSASRRLERLQIAERAARELSGPRPLRARVQRSASLLRLTYPLEPGRRGRWPVGPLEVQRRDLFDVVRWSGPLGEPMLVAVRPAVTAIETSNRAASTDVDRAAIGARTAAADDSSLRDYRPGDDLRRVHWRSSARRGQILVRQDERAGRRPATVLLDLPMDDIGTEWTIATGASIAVALVHGGHHVRMLGGDVLGVKTDHHRPDTDGMAVAALLDQTVDLVAAPDPVTRGAWLGRAVDTLGAQAGGAELVFAVVGALDAASLAALARVGDASHGWAMVRSGRPGLSDPPSVHEASTLTTLRRAGWTACAVRPGEDVAACWQRLLDSDERAGMAR